jgi:hypothetical protein
MTSTCGVDGSTIYYDVGSIDLKADPSKAKPASAFEAVFLGDVITDIESECMIVKQQCKSQYPAVNRNNWRNWLTSIDQENRVSIAHTIEKAGIPILYNTPRLCDPGIAISRNWNLRNYIETRLYLFKYVYDFGKKAVNRANNTSCYPSVVFDFRPFEYKFVLDGAQMYVTQWITVEQGSGAEGYTPHFRLSRERTPPDTNTTAKLFDDIVLKLITGKNFGSSSKSIINQSYNLGPEKIYNNVNSFLSDFKNFIVKYDGARFINSSANNILGNTNNFLPIVTLTPDVIRVLYYDLIHDKVVDKTQPFEKFRKKFKSEFLNFVKPVTREEWIGAGKAATSYKKYGTIFVESPAKLGVPQHPAIFKTLGDLSQFIYAGKYQTIVASGDKMGLATGLYVNAKNNRILKCMMEDVVTGFIVYTGIKDITFTSKKTCNTYQNQACLRNPTISKEVLAGEIIASIPTNKQANVKNIINKKPKPVMGLKTQIKSWLNIAQNVNEKTANGILNTVNKVVNYLNDSDIKYILNFMNRLNARKNISESQKFRISNIRGKIKVQLNNKNGSAMNVNTARPGTARPNNNAQPTTKRTRR